MSDTRTPSTDGSGDLMEELAVSAGHRIVGRDLVPDDPGSVRERIQSFANNRDVNLILVNGGTGISAHDCTYETVAGLIDRPLPGFGELFRTLSFQEIGAAAMGSRATAGVVGRVLLFCTPGSPAAVRLAMEKLILPEAPHLVGEMRKEQ